MSLQIPDDLITTLAAAERVVVLTGAGISAESGVPTFREAQTGLWAQYDPRELATPQAFARNPRLVWEWYAWRRKLIQQAKPNLAHHALVDLEQALPTFLLVTQNIDGFHWLAGSRDMIELHGNIARTRCYEEGHVVSWWEETDELPPRCPHCGGPLRPDVVWFGEGISEQALRSAFDAAAACDLFISVGTSAMVQPAAGLPLLAKRMGARVLEINPAQTALSVIADWSLQDKASNLLPQLVRRLDFPTNAIDGAEQ
ncbi:MAG: NAD-dependent protein deacylase [Chloroflexi bacterium]|nr:MAG: NAD-dependent protein deacylase [Chloroflexota bacterium]